jgi:hypothetical protein
MNQINTTQNVDEQIQLLHAQRIFYGRAKMQQTIFVIFAILLPALSLLLASHLPKSKPYFALAGIFLLLLEIGLFTKLQKENTKRGAKVQEQFDTRVFDLEWNQFVAGAKVDIEDIQAVVAHGIPERNIYENWYEPEVADLPIKIARIICQRTNVTYDTRIRRWYAAFLLWSVIILGASLLATGMYQGLPFSEIVLTIIVPFVPLMTFALREFRKQSDSIDALANLKSEVDKLWSKAMKNPNADGLTHDARTLQDAIYRNRVSNPLVYDWVYRLNRKKNEDLAYSGAKALVKEAKAAMKSMENA